ncbi:hypothetical protein TELCIR_02011 [Teladorsagia circumcincta]|uniref:Uncharacterized protein n=1 Tax=Teladorsagia circumcincta TaxID=45464 RepID=A0A2G9V0K1_TELCI|nr:hypothetical protein TELCIR_02011 [Teladorsagia circumcincta]
MCWSLAWAFNVFDLTARQLTVASRSCGLMESVPYSPTTFTGYPIVGDQIYNSTVWGDSKGKGAKYGKSYDELCVDVRAAHRSSNWHETVDPEYESKMERMAKEELTPEPTDLQAQDRPTYDPICLNCNVTKKEVPPDHFQLYLHCLKYSTEKWSYSTPLPEWAVEPESS